MVVINTIIPSQGFELVRDRIGAILADEVNNQYVLTSNEDINADVYVERVIALDKVELPAINVRYAEGSFDNQNQGHSDHTGTFFIDVYHSAKSTTLVEGDKLSMIKNQRLLGVCRAILEDSQYKTLMFVPPFIMNRQITDINVAVIDDKDTLHTSFSRLTMTVRFAETTPFLAPTTATGYDTQVKLEETEKGYKYVVNN